jgi:hypothetical protein
MTALLIMVGDIARKSIERSRSNVVLHSLRSDMESLKDRGVFQRQLARTDYCLLKKICLLELSIMFLMTFVSFRKDLLVAISNP